eukprot:TRINITY_DN8732_c0_g1::TRINITY_DN8732_c0_g1_i1::g.23950::m.23950 TRINITY_DN8732_c0_g1::TRINITY_DN8732_c0_g1_i1::g.23950  ORF type:complete len:158 (-),score=67.80,sp/Q9CQK7/RWDD1_MOUSE/42.71/8e-08 TRINITY_DN8732_c0_g1_i1:48-521(-)
MIFNLHSFAKEWIEGNLDDTREREVYDDTVFESSKELVEEEDHRKHGTPVTAESFMEWRVKFEAEQTAKRLAAEANNPVKRVKISGKEYFLKRMAAQTGLDEDEFVDDANVEVDESLFLEDNDNDDIDNDDDDDDDAEFVHSETDDDGDDDVDDDDE